MQTAILWWRLLYSEIGLLGHGTTDGQLGDAAKQRHHAVLDLFFDCLSTLQVETFLEIGAHEASASKRFVTAINKSGKAHAYEAAPGVYATTVASGIPENMQLFHCAIGNEGREVKFYQPKDKNLWPMSSTRSRRGAAIDVEEFTVQMITLNEAGRRAKPAFGRRSGLWIDVEGQALDVLRSGEEFIKDRVALIYAEVQDFNTYDGGATALEIMQLILSLGFIPVARDNQHADAWNFLALHESAYLQLREKLAFWFRAHSGMATVSNWLRSAEFGKPVF